MRNQEKEKYQAPNSVKTPSQPRTARTLSDEQTGVYRPQQEEVTIMPKRKEDPKESNAKETGRPAQKKPAQKPQKTDEERQD